MKRQYSGIRPHVYLVILAIFLSIAVIPGAIPPLQVQANVLAELTTSFGLGYDDTTTLATGDMDNDGDIDLVVGNSILPELTSGIPNPTIPLDKQNVVLLNDGRGNFQSGSFVCGSTAGVRCFGTGTDATRSVAVGDMNNDGSLDIVVGNLGEQNAVYLNDGQGNFAYGDLTCGSTSGVRCFGTAASNTLSIAVGDVNGDNRLDIAVGTHSESGDVYSTDGAQDAVYLNQGDAIFAAGGHEVNCADIPRVRCFGASDSPTYSLALGDISGDGNLDLVVGHKNQPNALYINTGNGTFILARSFGGPDWTSSIALGDLNRDGKLDIAVSKSALEWQNERYLNDGRPDYGFLSAPQPIRPKDASGRVATARIDLGDMNGDGFLDYILANIKSYDPKLNAMVGAPSTILLALPSSEIESSITIAPEASIVMSMVPADFNGDGALDLAMANYGQQNWIYLNNGAGDLHFDKLEAARPLEGDRTRSLVVADLNADGLLDLAMGNDEQPGTIYLADPSAGGNPRNIHKLASHFGVDTATMHSLAAGDVDRDGDLDLVVAYGTPLEQPGDSSSASPTDAQNVVYLNDGQGHFHRGQVVCGIIPTARCFGTATDNTHSVALADLDRDGNLDIAAGNFAGQSMVYLNDGQGNFSFNAVGCDDSLVVRCFGSGADQVSAIAIADADGDGDPDIALGNTLQQSFVYLNDGAGNFSTARPFGDGTSTFPSLVWGDFDGDGDSDIAESNLAQNRIYLNDGAGNFAHGSVTCASTEVLRCIGSGTDFSYGIASGDLDGDGDLDLAIAQYGIGSVVYLNDGTGQFRSLRVDDNPAGMTVTAGQTIALADMNGDGVQDVILGAGEIFDVPALSGNSIASGSSPFNLPRVSIQQPGGMRAAGSGTSPVILNNQVIPISYKLISKSGGKDGESVRFVRAFFSLDGGGKWQPAVAASGTVTTYLQVGSPQIYHWDTFASGFFGQSDNVVFRIEAYPDIRTPANGIPGPFQVPFTAAQSFPFRVRGTQVRVLDDSGEPVAGAYIYRQTDGQSEPGTLIANAIGQPFTTDAQGYMQGYGSLSLNDQLVALAPISATDTYTLYATSATPTATGLDMTPLTAAGVQTVTVSLDHPLILFNLDIALEWDARTDQHYLDQLSFDMQRASEILYDWTDGQAALGDITLFHNREQWDDAHIRMYATNRLRPNANEGGIVSSLLAEPANTDTEYEPGQLRIGAVWNRYGEASGTLGEDWPRTLAHELGHYALFLDDNYLGLDAQGLVIPITTCRGAMSDPYLDNNSEFHPADSWSPDCDNTLSHQSTGRSDWETIETFYPYLASPATFNANPGPVTLPLDVTHITTGGPLTPTRALDVSLFYLVDSAGRSVTPGAGAQAVLYPQEGTHLVDLGNPALDQVTARGASAGDTLCIYHLDAGQLGCEEVRTDDQQVTLYTLPADRPWQPDILITPVTSRTIDLAVANLPDGLELWAQLFPSDNDALPAVTLTRQGDHYVGQFVQSDDPSFEGTVHIWVEESAPRRESISSYTIGGSPAPRGRKNAPRGRKNAPRGRKNAPVLSSDGQASLYTRDEEFPEGEFYTLQSTRVISPPDWATPVGQAYRLIATAGAPQLQGQSSIKIDYLSNDVVSGEEDWIQIYYQESDGQWRPLTTTLNTDLNAASAPTQGMGRYALMSSIRVALHGPGWNNIAYPVHAMRPISEALRSIEGLYSSVWSYDPQQRGWEAWTGYHVGIPAWASDLKQMEFGRGYWISMTQTLSTSLYLRGSSTSAASTQAMTAEQFSPTQAPVPALYYGTLYPDIASAGAQVTARINDVLCGSGRVEAIEGTLVYHITVAADGSTGIAGCGAPGQQVRIQLGNRVRSAPWNNNAPNRLLFTGPATIYLPFIQRSSTE